jgi:hypothetical protein
VLGLSALVASVVSPPETGDSPRDEPAEALPQRPSGGSAGVLRLTVPADRHGERPLTRQAPVGSRVSLEVTVPGPGDVTIEGLGLTQSADRLTRARFDLISARPGSHAVLFTPVSGRSRTAGRIAFGAPSSVRPRPAREP